MRRSGNQGSGATEDRRFDDVNIAQFTSPGLTTIHQPVEQMAELAVAAIAQIDEGKVVPTKTVFPVTLVERGTT